jgi:hypothetical protein
LCTTPSNRRDRIKATKTRRTTGQGVREPPRPPHWLSPQVARRPTSAPSSGSASMGRHGLGTGMADVGRPRAHLRICVSQRLRRRDWLELVFSGRQLTGRGRSMACAGDSVRVGARCLHVEPMPRMSSAAKRGNERLASKSPRSLLSREEELGGGNRGRPCVDPSAGGGRGWSTSGVPDNAAVPESDARDPLGTTGACDRSTPAAAGARPRLWAGPAFGWKNGPSQMLGVIDQQRPQVADVRRR